MYLRPQLVICLSLWVRLDMEIPQVIQTPVEVTSELAGKEVPCVSGQVWLLRNLVPQRLQFRYLPARLGGPEN